MLQKFGKNLRNNLEGKDLGVSGTKYTSGAKINDLFANLVYTAINGVSDDLNEEYISKTLANLTGYRSTVLPDQLALDKAVGKLTENYKKPLKKSLQAIKNEVLTAVTDVSYELLKDYPQLKAVIVTYMKKG